RPDRRRALDLGRSRLSGRRPRTRVPSGHRPSGVCRCDRRGGARRLPRPRPVRGDHSRARAGTRARPRPRARCRADPRRLVRARTHELAPETPLVPMTYASLLEAYGWERFAADIEEAGAASMIIVDLPAGERADVRRVQLVAPTSTDERIALAGAQTDGWLY